MSKKNDLQESVKLAKRISSDFKQLWETLGKPKEKINRFQKTSFFDMIDELSNIKCELIAKTDGRPQALDFSKAYCVPVEQRDQYPQQALEELDEDFERFKCFGECFGPGFEDKASLGNVHLSMADLIKARDWIDAVIKWHEKNPKRTK